MDIEKLFLFFSLILRTFNYVIILKTLNDQVRKGYLKFPANLRHGQFIHEEILKSNFVKEMLKKNPFNLFYATPENSSFDGIVFNIEDIQKIIRGGASFEKMHFVEFKTVTSPMFLKNIKKWSKKYAVAKLAEEYGIRSNFVDSIDVTAFPGGKFILSDDWPERWPGLLEAFMKEAAKYENPSINVLDFNLHYDYVARKVNGGGMRMDLTTVHDSVGPLVNDYFNYMESNKDNLILFDNWFRHTVSNHSTLLSSVDGNNLMNLPILQNGIVNKSETLFSPLNPNLNNIDAIDWVAFANDSSSLWS